MNSPTYRNGLPTPRATARTSAQARKIRTVKKPTAWLERWELEFKSRWVRTVDGYFRAPGWEKKEAAP
jgi:hypothetical protein